MRKKFTLVLLLYASGTVLAFVGDASLSEYTAFAAMLFTGFGVADLVDKKLPNHPES